MDGLRWILLIIGGLVVLGVYLYSRSDRSKPETASTDDAAPDDVDAPRLTDRVEPSIGGEESGSDDPVSPEMPEAAAAEQQKVVTLRVVAGDKQPFAGDELILSLRGIGMRHGKFGIFHQYDGDDENRVVYSAASLIEPGSFDLENIKEQEIPGITLFMVLPGPIDGAEAFDLMMTASRTLTQSLNAELLDESGSTLSIQRERYLREEIIQFQHSILVA
ncbi:MAG: cell division protein ZipA C-terminal FtsZ-binding domain-containing protein [Pseudomonadota bacterium]